MKIKQLLMMFLVLIFKVYQFNTKISLFNKKLLKFQVNFNSEGKNTEFS